jgi:hypothetical protein
LEKAGKFVVGGGGLDLGVCDCKAGKPQVAARLAEKLCNVLAAALSWYWKIKFMKNVIIGILLVATLGLGGLLLQKNNAAKEAAAKLEAAQKQLADLQAGIAQQEEDARRLKERLETAQMDSFANANAAARLSQALTNRSAVDAAPAATNSKPANPLAEMFKNPEMRDMIRKQQKTVLGTMVDKNYADFFKSMNLTAEQSAAMKDLILDKMLGGAEMGMEMMGGEMDAEKRGALIAKMKESNEAVDGKIKELLGPENHALYEAYEKTIPDRMAVGQLEDQLRDGSPMNANQKDLMIAAMSEERQGFKFTTDFSDRENFTEDMFSRFTEDRMNLYFQEQDQLNQRYLARAQQILSADQFAAYQKSLKNQQEMARMGMKMAAQMFGPKK